jgi:hypothetical protein
VQLAPGHRLDVDVGFVLAGLREIVGHLQPQPRFRAAAECLVEAADVDLPRERLYPNAKPDRFALEGYKFK